MVASPMSLTESVKRSSDEASRVLILKPRKSGVINLHHEGVKVKKGFLKKRIFFNGKTGHSFSTVKNRLSYNLAPPILCHHPPVRIKSKPGYFAHFEAFPLCIYETVTNTSVMKRMKNENSLKLTK
jgi:hypothetical protein